MPAKLDMILGTQANALREKVNRNKSLEEKLKFNFDLIPVQLYEKLAKYVIGQDDSLRDISNAVCYHYKGLGNKEKIKNNLLLIGPTGCGKTYVIEKVSDILEVPLVKVDITKYSGTGYIGDKVENIILDLVSKANGDFNSASRGIIYIDEVDKIAIKEGAGRDVSGRDVQNGLLKLVEGSETTIPFGKVNRRFSTKDVLFIAGGAFSDLYKNLKGEGKITGFADSTRNREMNDGETLYSAQPDELIKGLGEYGMMPEFLGRFPVVSRFRQLGNEDLLRILKESEESPVKNYKKSFGAYGIDIEFTDDALVKIAELSAKRGIGARGIKSVMESALNPYKFYLPGSGIEKITLSSEAIEKPEETVLSLLEEQQIKLQGGKNG